MTQKVLVGIVGTMLLVGIAGCKINVSKDANGQDKNVTVETPFSSVHVNKDANGKDENVRVETPFGGVHVNTDQTKATDMGLAAYPGAQAVKRDGDHDSADVHLGFGEWQLRVRAVSYASSDSREKISAFYKQELSHFSDVITCQGNAAMGSPAVTSQGLTCNCNDTDKTQIHTDALDRSKNGLQLKAGSKRHQHIVAFDDSKDGKTGFTLISLDLPAAVDGAGGKKD